MLFGTHTSFQIKKNQQKIEMILDSKKIAYDKLDVAADEGLKKKMREISKNPTALPPQLCNGDQYCGVSNQHIVFTASYLYLSYTLILLEVVAQQKAHILKNNLKLDCIVVFIRSSCCV